MATLLDNLISYWKFDGNSTDSLGINSGTDTDVSYSAANGKIKQGAGFNGTSSKIVGSAQTIATNATIACWFKTSQTPSGNLTIFGFRDSADHSTSVCGMWFGNLDTSGDIFFGVKDNSANFNYISSTDFNDGNWHYAVGTKSGNTIELFIDGESQGSDNSVTFSGTFTGALLRVGSLTGSGDFYSGTIDEGAYWDRVLTSTEITNLYNSGNGLQYTFGLGKVKTLVIGGGGGSGGTAGSGGGGGGGYQYFDSFPVSAQTYTIAIGAGGLPGVGTPTNSNGGNGGNSIFSTIQAQGGGGGGGLNTDKAGRNGGCGGGGGDPIGAKGTGSQGYDGGTGGTNGAQYEGGGGGGAGGAGANGNTIPNYGGNGGVGLANSISGSSVYYAGGGGGGNTDGLQNGTGGNGGGGNGLQNGTDGLGGGAGCGDSTGGKTGGKGVVIISFKSDNSDGIVSASTSATGTYAKTTSGGYDIYTFTGNGTFTPVIVTNLSSTLPTINLNLELPIPTLLKLLSLVLPTINLNLLFSNIVESLVTNLHWKSKNSSTSSYKDKNSSSSTYKDKNSSSSVYKDKTI